MRAIAIGILAFSALADAQTTDLRERVFFLTYTPTVPQFQEVATVIRTIADIKEIAADNERKSVTVHATPGQIAMAEWLFNELDNPARQTSVPHEYRVPESDEIVRLFYLTAAPTTQDFQEIATLVRTITNIRRVFTYNAPKALVIRGTPTQAALAEWLVKELEPKSSPAAAEYQVAPGDQPHDENVVGVVYLTHASSVQDFQKAAMQIRSLTNITRVFTYNRSKALALRGTAEQIAQAERLAQELDKP